jgi:hypothetical protein
VLEHLEKARQQRSGVPESGTPVVCFPASDARLASILPSNSPLPRCATRRRRPGSG